MEIVYLIGCILTIGYIITVAVLYFFLSSEGESNVGWMIVCSFIAIAWPIIVVPGIGIWIGKTIRRRIE